MSLKAPKTDEIKVVACTEEFYIQTSKMLISHSYLFHAHSPNLKITEPVCLHPRCLGPIQSAARSTNTQSLNT